jgi:hypothetical protein
MSKKETPVSISKKAGFYLGYSIGSLIIFATGLLILWITMEPYH